MAQSTNSQETPHNHYQVLGVSNDSNTEEIRLAYEEQLGKIGDFDSPDFMEEITRAYEVLSDSDARVQYDDELRDKGEWQPQIGEQLDEIGEDLDEEDEEEEEVDSAGSEAEAVEDEIQDEREWYVVHSYSGYENKVKKNLEHRIESMAMQDLIFQVVVPTEEEVELRDGQRKTTERRVFPGYILVEMIMTDDSWYVVRNTPGVTGFVGSANAPIPLRPDEVDKILKRMEAPMPKVKINLNPGNKVRIVEGPFADFMGTVEDLLLEKGKVRILVSFFGRETPVELDFLQVERI